VIRTVPRDAPTIAMLAPNLVISKNTEIRSSSALGKKIRKIVPTAAVKKAPKSTGFRPIFEIRTPADSLPMISAQLVTTAFM